MANLATLSAKERALALKLAESNRAAKHLLKGRSRAILIAPVAPDRAQPEDARQAVVGFYNYTANRSVAVAVDLKAGKAMGVEETPAQFQLSVDEEREATKVASKDRRVKAALGGRKMNQLVRLYFPPYAHAHDPPHRYAIVFLRPTKSERRYAVVDLSEQRVVDVMPAAITVQ